MCIYTPHPATAHVSVDATEVGSRHPGRGAGDGTTAHVEVVGCSLTYLLSWD